MAENPDCIIIGGGVIGLSIARRLAREHVRVTLLERGRCGIEASWAAAGVLTPCNPHRNDAIAALRQRSLSMFSLFCDELIEETGIDPEYEPCGELEIALNADSLRSLQDDAKAGASRRLPDDRPAYQLLSPEETRRIEPVVSESILGALECRETAQVRNPRLLRALHAACLKAGVDIREETPVHDFVLDGSRVTGVRTEKGELPAEKVILCAGAWSSQIGQRLHELMPVHPVRGQIILMKFESRPFTRVISRGKTYLVPRRDGHVLLGATQEHDAGYNKRNTPKGIADLFEKGIKLVPSIADAAVVTQWAGLRPGTPDDNPYIGPVPGFDGLIAATGHFRSGLILAPVTAEIVASLIQGRDYDIDLSACRPGRA
ncbi:MAG: glycine oxidase ThiO [Planctomycetota bacterium]